MSQYNDGRPLFGSKDVPSTRLGYVNEFASWVDPEDGKRCFKELLFTALSSKDADNWSAEERSYSVFLFDCFCKLVDGLAATK